MIRDDIVRIILANLQNVQAIYLFGSESMGEQHAQSDIDLAILSNTRLPETRLWELAQMLASKMSREVDVIDLKQASTVMRLQIISTGQCLFCLNEKLCTAFEDFVYSDYARLNEERASILQDIHHRGSVYG